MEKKKEIISLKTDLPPTPIIPKLRDWLCQNFTEIINKPTKKNKKRSLSNLSFSKSRSNTASVNETFSSEINFEKFSPTELLTCEDSPKSKNSSQSISFKVLMEQDYSSYISLLRKMYPSFKLNHYSKYSEKIRNSQLRNKQKNQINEEYISSNNLFDSLALTDNYVLSPDKFKIKQDILEKEDTDVLDMISHDFDIKGGIIEREINNILSQNYTLIYDFVKHNMQVGKEIDDYVLALNGKKLSKQTLTSNYIRNTSKIILKGRKKRNLITFSQKTKELQQLSLLTNNLHSIEQKNVKELSEILNNIKTLISKIRKWDKFRKIQVVNQCEKELMSFENKNEEKLLEQFAMSVLKLFNLCININETQPEINSGRNDIQSSMNFNLEKTENDTKLNNSYSSKDFIFENESNNISFILIYNNPSTTQSLLITLLEIINLIIKDNVDIFSIIERLERIFKSLIIRIFDSMQKIKSLSNNEMIYVISNAFVVVNSNYNYLINLFMNNFGLMPKIFIELTKTINNEMNQIIKALISSTMQEYIINGDTKGYITKLNDIYYNMETYVNFNNQNWNEYTKTIHNSYIISFFDKKSSDISHEIKNEKWSQYNEINENYQKKIDIIFQNEPTQPNKEYLIIKGDKFKVVKFTLSIVDFIYDVIFLDKEIKSPPIKKELTEKCYSLSFSILQQTKDILIGNNSDKAITEKEITLFCSHNLIFHRCINYFTSIFPNKDIDNIFNEINLSCIDAMSQLLSQISESTINEFKTLDFTNYPTFTEKDFNNYIKKFCRMKKLYDIMVGAFDKKDIIDIFNKIFKSFFDLMESVVESKPKIEDDAQLKQFRAEMVYLKKVLKLFDLINVDIYREKIDTLSKNVNPKKIAKKKKAKEINEEKDNSTNKEKENK